MPLAAWALVMLRPVMRAQTSAATSRSFRRGVIEEVLPGISPGRRQGQRASVERAFRPRADVVRPQTCGRKHRNFRTYRLSNTRSSDAMPRLVYVNPAGSNGV